MKKFIVFALIFNVASTVSAQVPYTPFPKDSLSWNVKGWNAFDPYSAGYAEFTLTGKDTVIDDKNYTQVIDVQERFIAGIREENKKVYTYIPNFGEHLLYDFNLEVGDTIFYDIGLAVWWDNFSTYLLWNTELKHYAIVTEKGIITLMDGSTRNTITAIYTWIEGLGTATGMGLFSPLNVAAVPDGTSFKFVCANNKKSINAAGECIVYIHESDEVCPCSPMTSIIKNEKNEINLFPNPTTGQLTINNEQCGGF